ncbi:AI-2E family transporter [Pseudomonadota bacterium]
MKKLISPGATFLIVTACFVVVAAGMKAAAPILVPFLLALFIALISAPPLLWLQDKGIPKGLALLIVISLQVGCCLILASVLTGSVKDFTDALPEYQQSMKQHLIELHDVMDRFGIDPPRDFINKTFNTEAVVKLTSNVLLGLSAMVANLLFVMLMAIFILLEASGFPSKIRRMSGASEQSMGQIRNYIDNVKRYIFLKTIISLGTGIFIAVWLAVFGVDQYVLWGLLAFFLNFVPNIGSIIAAVPAVLLALVQGGFELAMWATVGYVIVNLVVGNVVEPKVMGRGLGLSSLVVLLSMVFWGYILGPVGMLLSIPLTMMVKIGLEGNEKTQWVSVLLGPEEDPPSH